MGNFKVSINFSSNVYSDSELANKANFILEKMTGNAYFETPAPPLSELRTANDNYVASLAKMESGSKEDTVVKNNNRVTLENVLKVLAAYVQTTSNGDEAIILSSGFDVNKKPSPVGQLEKPENLIVRQGANKGSVVISCDVVPNANFYEFQYTLAPVTDETVWVLRTTTKHKMQVDELTSGKQYTFRVAGAGSDPSRVWSEEITSYIL